MEKSVLDKLIPSLKDIARDAGAETHRIAQGPVEADRKADGSPVTRADRASHRIIVPALERLDPSLPIISEEGDLPEPGIDAFPDQFWLVDPLDGTKEFLKKNGEYTINIALIERGIPILGVIYAPALDGLYWAAAGMGAQKQEAGEKPRRIMGSREGPFTAAISRSHASPEVESYLERLGVEEIVRCGSSIKLCAVAEGKADIYPRFGPTCLWDTAAGAVIAREGGARVVDLQGEPLEYDPNAGLKHSGFIVYSRLYEDQIVLPEMG
ncbi:MAG: 3'(2'),5'-bisphosphate nucleotidase CysQ [Planctomycetes bacterium]|nr:3'(2'),5'-bisphosphate nucleotidase CysQ [Planctomycetota bacterium]